jgi:hypothetical protein
VGRLGGPPQAGRRHRRVPGRGASSTRRPRPWAISIRPTRPATGGHGSRWPSP